MAASLRRLQALLAAPDALPRRSLAPLLQRLAAAGELRRRLQNFVVAFTLGSAAAAPVGGSARIAHGEALSGLVPDSVQHAFAVAVEEVLRRQSAALQQLELQQGTAWVQTVAVGGTQGRQLHSRGPTLLQVALHSGGLQLQLRRLAELCWCTDSWQTSCLDQAGDEREQGGLDSSCRWQDGGFPAGTELLAYLYSRASEAGEGQGMHRGRRGVLGMHAMCVRRWPARMCASERLHPCIWFHSINMQCTPCHLVDLPALTPCRQRRRAYAALPLCASPAALPATPPLLGIHHQCESPCGGGLGLQEAATLQEQLLLLAVACCSLMLGCVMALACPLPASRRLVQPKGALRGAVHTLLLAFTVA